MKPTIRCLALLFLAAANVHAQDATLFRTTQGAMVFQETERNDDASTVEASQLTGHVATKSMFLLRASCALTKARGKAAFRSERLPGPALRFTIRFVPAEEAAREAPGKPLGEGSIVTAALCDHVENVLHMAGDAAGAPR